MNLWALAAACLLIAVAVAAGRLASRRSAPEAAAPASGAGNPVSVIVSADAASAAQTGRLARLEAESSTKGLEAAKLRGQLQALQARWSQERVAARAAGDELAAARTDYEERLDEVSLQRDRLSGQLREASQVWQKLQTELAGLRAERDPTLLRLPFVNRMHGFVSLDRPVGSPEKAESLARSHAPFDGAVILLQDVVQILQRAQPLLDHSWITRISVDVYHSRCGVVSVSAVTSVDAPTLVGRLSVLSQMPLQLRGIALYPAPHCPT